MKIKYFCPRWGSEYIPWKDFCVLVKEAGFDGVESPVSFDPEEKIEMISALEQNGLLLIGQYYQSFEKDFDLHKQSYVHHIKNIAGIKPALIDSQTGKDYFTLSQNSELFRIAAGLQKESGINIAHETHRNKALFAAHAAKGLLTDNPDIRITADFSHWCNVSEGLLEDQDEAVDLAIQKTIHIHARVGHAQSAQVPDPRAPEWRKELETHLTWWDGIVRFRKKQGESRLTITPEFGPAPYMPAMPYTGVLLANQWEINIYMMNLLKTRYQ